MCEQIILTSDEISLLRELLCGRHIEYMSSCASTNDYLSDRAGELEDGNAVLTLNQTAGHGRLGRSWQSLPGQTLALSWLHKNPSVSPSPSITAGLATVYALREYGIKAVLKWPNDVLVDEKKVSGILCSSRIGVGGVRLVVGIGINLLQPTDFFKSAELPNAGSIYSLTGHRLSVPRLAASIINGYFKLTDTSGTEQLSDYKKVCITLGRQVTAGDICGRAEDINPDGSLVIKSCDGKTHSVNAGEVSVRGIYGYI